MHGGTDMTTTTRFSIRHTIPVLAFVAGVLLAITSVGAIGSAEQQQSPIHLDFAYDTSDQSLVAGDASVIVVGQVTRELRRAGDRTIYEIELLGDPLKGNVQRTVNVSQIGFNNGDATHSLEGVGRLEVGDNYILAAVHPSRTEPQDALVVLSTVPGGNAIPVDGYEDPAVDEYREAVAQQQDPLPGSENAQQRQEAQEAWETRNGPPNDGRP